MIVARSFGFAAAAAVIACATGGAALLVGASPDHARSLTAWALIIWPTIAFACAAASALIVRRA